MFSQSNQGNCNNDNIINKVQKILLLPNVSVSRLIINQEEFILITNREKEEIYYNNEISSNGFSNDTNNSSTCCCSITMIKLKQNNNRTSIDKIYKNSNGLLSSMINESFINDLSIVSLITSYLEGKALNNKDSYKIKETNELTNSSKDLPSHIEFKILRALKNNISVVLFSAVLTEENNINNNTTKTSNTITLLDSLVSSFNQKNLIINSLKNSIIQKQSEIDTFITKKINIKNNNRNKEKRLLELMTVKLNEKKKELRKKYNINSDNDNDKEDEVNNESKLRDTISESEEKSHYSLNDL